MNSKGRTPGRVATSDRAIRALQTTKAQEDVRITGVPGLRIRVSKTGRKTFTLVYRSPEPAHLQVARRPQRRISLGVYPDLLLAGARAKAKIYHGELAKGLDPQGSRILVTEQVPLAKPRPGARDVQVFYDPRLRPILGTLRPTKGSFAHLAAEYLVRHAWVNKKRTCDDESMLRRDVIPCWGARPAADIRRRDVIDLLDFIIGRGAPIAARATKALVSKIFSFGISRDLVEHNPAIGVIAPMSKSREVWLRTHQIRTLWAELDCRPLITASIFRMILLTLQRPGEVCAMEWEEIEGDWWEMPGAKTKNSRTHRVFLSKEAQAILALLHPHTGHSRYVFQSRNRDGRARVWINKAGSSICKATGLSFTPHDLRRTGATHLGEMGVSDEVIDAILNHAGTRRVVKIYNRCTYDTQKRAALAAWGERVAEIARSSAPQAMRWAQSA